MRILGLDHVQLAMPAGGEAEAVAFYEGLLGIPQVPKPPHLAARGGCWFERGTLKVHLGVDPTFRPATKAHPAFLVDDVRALATHLTEAGVPVIDDEPLDGYHRIYVTDSATASSSSSPEADARRPAFGLAVTPALLPLSDVSVNFSVFLVIERVFVYGARHGSSPPRRRRLGRGAAR